MNKNVLVVDDVEDWQKTFSGLLTDEGYVVTAVGDREAALEVVRTNKFDLAIIDIRLDETDEDDSSGLDLAAELKSFQRGLPVVMITGYDTLEAIGRALKPDNAGHTLANDFVRKTDAYELIDVVKRVMGPSAG